MTEEEFNVIASATKDTGLEYKGIPILSNPYIEPGIIYFINDDCMETGLLKRQKPSLLKRTKNYLTRIFDL